MNITPVISVVFMFYPFIAQDASLQIKHHLNSSMLLDPEIMASQSVSSVLILSVLQGLELNVFPLSNDYL